MLQLIWFCRLARVSTVSHPRLARHLGGLCDFCETSGASGWMKLFQGVSGGGVSGGKVRH